MSGGAAGPGSPGSRKELVSASATYEGQLNEQGRKHGKGTLKWDDGDVFEGEFQDDEKVRGTFRWKGGDVYVGEFKDSLMHGEGTYTYKDGRVYTGQWAGGFKHGRGLLRYPNGDSYEGWFERDQCAGAGVYVHADGRVYRGAHQHDQRHGYGSLMHPAGDRVDARFRNNFVDGRAIVTDAAGRRYVERQSHGAVEGARLLLPRSDAQMRELLAAVAPPSWRPDGDFRECFLCRIPFSLLTRRHHCRHCGFVCCDSCSTTRMNIPRMGLVDVRVCDECTIAVNCAAFSPNSSASVNSPSK